MASGATEWVWQHSRAANGPLIVLLAIARECGKEWTTEMTTAELARKSRLSERAVQNAVGDLTAAGELSFTPRPGRAGGNRYVLNPAESAPNPAESAGFAPTPQNLHPEKSAGFVERPPSSGPNTAESAGFEISDESSTTGLPVVEKPLPAPRPDVDRLCAHLADRIAANGSKRPNITKRWKDAARLLIDNDGRTEDQAHKAIDWCQDDEFWRTNILSMPKLREKYDQLRLKASQRKAPPRQTADDDYAAALQRIQARKENGNGTGGNGHHSPAGQVSLPAAANRQLHLRDLAPRHRSPGFRRRSGRSHRHRPLGEILLRSRHPCRSWPRTDAQLPPVRPHCRRSARNANRPGHRCSQDRAHT